MLIIIFFTLFIVCLIFGVLLAIEDFWLGMRILGIGFLFLTIVFYFGQAKDEITDVRTLVYSVAQTSDGGKIAFFYDPIDHETYTSSQYTAVTTPELYVVEDKYSPSEYPFFRETRHEVNLVYREKRLVE